MKENRTAKTHKPIQRFFSISPACPARSRTLSASTTKLPDFLISKSKNLNVEVSKDDSYTQDEGENDGASPCGFPEPRTLNPPPEPRTLNPIILPIANETPMKQINKSIDTRVKTLLKKINAPVIVGTPPVNAFRDLVQLPCGELRHYGVLRENHETKPIYIASHDCGLSWQKFLVTEGCPGACVQSPWSGDWITLIDAHDMKNDLHLHDVPLGLSPGLHVCRSSVGIDGPFEFMPVSELHHAMPRQPLAMFSRKRWIQCCQRKDKDGRNCIVVFRSDDDGRTWKETLLGSIPPHVATGHHRGVRWQNYGCEPTVAELSDGRLWVIIRTSQDNHYEAFSEDGGETWTHPTPSRFYGTITMPTLFRMRDGRILFFWCNTTPLPELDHDLQKELVDWERQGYGEDIFTNRDAFHAAISDDDGRTWTGFRELLLNERRNDSDFRTSGGNGDCLDKSVHQSQAVELPEGKVLVSVGQHPLCRKLLIFDPTWLYETSRSDDFRYGLGDWSVQQYVKGIVGNFKGISGHCAYNRRPGAQLVPAPDGEPREVLQIARHPDPRLVEETQGAVWNFPAAQSGELRVDLRMPSGSHGFRLCLMDRWFNPTDTVAHESAMYRVEVDASGCVAGTPLVLSPDVWHTMTILWTDSRSGQASLSVGGKTFALPLKTKSLSGICYLHMMSLADSADFEGVLIRNVDAKVKSRDSVFYALPSDSCILNSGEPT